MSKQLLIILLLIFSVVQVAVGTVSTIVYLADANTPLEIADVNTPFKYRDIMVGTKLVVIIDSDLAERWDGGLFITDAYSDYGVLSGRDYNDITLDWEGSRLEAAGSGAWVNDWQDAFMSGFNFYGDRNAVAGEWFIIDYTATKVGTCHVDFYDYSVDWFVPIYNLTFIHVPTRDFNSDTIVDFHDFAVFSSYWQLTDCNNSGFCKTTDLSNDGRVDIDDLLLFTDYWLERTEIAAVDPNSPGG